jgi:hypothetical protein
LCHAQNPRIGCTAKSKTLYGKPQRKTRTALGLRCLYSKKRQALPVLFCHMRRQKAGSYFLTLAILNQKATKNARDGLRKGIDFRIGCEKNPFFWQKHKQK